MPKEVNPKDTDRAAAYKLWMKAPNPMVTFFKTFDVTNIIKVSRKRKLKFNMLLDYCIMGFQVYKRTERDEQGNPYPLLYMRRENDDGKTRAGAAPD